MDNVSRAEGRFLASGARRLTVYADFNSPCCHALSERIYAMDLESQVDFRFVVHQPDASSNQDSFDALARLVGEVAEVRRKFPSVSISLPTFRPDTRAAVAFANAVTASNPRSASRLRRRLFHALWIDGEDISDPELLADLTQDLEIELPVKPGSEKLRDDRWQREWESGGDFHRQVPAIRSEGGETLAGVVFEPELDRFLETGSLISDRALRSVAPLVDRQRVLVLDNDITCLRMLIEQLPEVQIEIARDLPGLVSAAVNYGVPDLVVVNSSLLGGMDRVDWWRSSYDPDTDAAMPVIFVSNDDSTDAEVAAFEAGASDFLVKPLHPKVLRARLRTHLQARRSQQQLKNIARIDALTSVCNRREFDLRLFSEWGRGARAGHTLALLMIDVDQFKQFNDYYGHLRGDDCLVRVAQALRGCVQRAGDLVARYGGEEFVVLLPGIDLEGASRVGRACVDAIHEIRIPHPSSTVTPYVTVSIGVAATRPIYENNCTLLVEQADIALYQAKQEGRNRVCRFEENG